MNDSDLSALADLIVSPSSRFEPPRRPAVTGTKALELFNELAPVTKRSLPIQQAPQQPAAPAFTPSSFAPAAPARPAVTVSNAEYRPALRDQSLVEALLQLHERTREAQGIKPPLKRR